MWEKFRVVGDLSLGEFEEPFVHPVHKERGRNGTRFDQRFDRSLQNPVSFDRSAAEEEHGFVHFASGHRFGFEDRIDEGIFFPIVRIIVCQDTIVAFELFKQIGSRQRGQVGDLDDINAKVDGGSCGSADRFGSVVITEKDKESEKRD